MTENEDNNKIPYENDVGDDDSDISGEQVDKELRLTDSVREFLIIDRGDECEMCGDEDASLEVHHRTPRAEGGSNNPENLLVLCRQCHQAHHDNTPIKERLEQKGISPSKKTSDADSDDTADPGSSDQEEPLPPKTTPNGADEQILSAIEEHGALSTGELAELLDYSNQYIRRQAWKLSGERLLVRTTDNKWSSANSVDEKAQSMGLPDSSKRAYRAGRDEVLRRLSASGTSHTEIASATGLSRSTIDIGVNRARAYAIGSGNTFPDDGINEVDVPMIATRLSSLIDLIEQSPE